MKKNLSLRFKLVLVCVVPLVLTICLLLIEMIGELEALKAQRLAKIEKTAYEQKQAVLKSYIRLALTSLDPILKQPPSLERDEAVIQLTNQLSYGDNGYFFISTYSGIAMANGRDPSIRGSNLYRAGRDIGSNKAMAENAKKGGDFIKYKALRKDKDVATLFPKLAYTVEIPGYDWYIGTGFYIDDVDELLNKERKRFDAVHKSILIKNIMMIVVLVIASMGVCFWLIGGSFKRLDIMRSGLKDISFGDGNLTRRIQDLGADEVGVCASSFNSFVKKIQQLVLGVQKESARINESTQRLDASSRGSYLRIQEQREKADMLASAINELLASAKEIALNTENASSSAESASQEAAFTLDRLTTAVRKLTRLGEDVGQSSTMINTLQKETNAIGRVLEVIQQIAAQTNLLALNAAIEAARAGEQGRGFAVVADEVRTLASRTQVSTKEIKEMIDRLQTGAQNAVAAMAVSLESSQDTIRQAEDSRASLERMNEAVVFINTLNTQISAAAEQQTRVTEDLNHNVLELSQMTEAAAREVEVIAGATEELKTNAVTLNEHMKYFSA
jgi:methyl-accepting chemotaxis protein